MSEKIDNFLKSVVSYKTQPTIYAVTELILDNKGKEVDTVAEKYLKSDINKANLRSFSTSLLGKIGREIEEYNIPRLLDRSRDELIQKANDRRIYLSSLTNNYLGSNEDKWFPNKAVKTEGLSDFSKARNVLRWINCMTEFYFEESLFQEEQRNLNLYPNISDNRTSFRELKQKMQQEVASCSTDERKPEEEQIHQEAEEQKFLREMTQIKEMMQNLTPEEEALIQKLWENGCLTCELSR